MNDENYNAVKNDFIMALRIICYGSLIFGTCAPRQDVYEMKCG